MKAQIKVISLISSELRMARAELMSWQCSHCWLLRENTRSQEMKQQVATVVKHIIILTWPLFRNIRWSQLSTASLTQTHAHTQRVGNSFRPLGYVLSHFSQRSRHMALFPAKPTLDDIISLCRVSLVITRFSSASESISPVQWSLERIWAYRWQTTDIQISLGSTVISLVGQEVDLLSIPNQSVALMMVADLFLHTMTAR